MAKKRKSPGRLCAFRGFSSSRFLLLRPPMVRCLVRCLVRCWTNTSPSETLCSKGVPGILVRCWVLNKKIFVRDTIGRKLSETCERWSLMLSLMVSDVVIDGIRQGEMSCLYSLFPLGERLAKRLTRKPTRKMAVVPNTMARYSCR